MDQVVMPMMSALLQILSAVGKQGRGCPAEASEA